MVVKSEIVVVVVLIVLPLTVISVCAVVVAPVVVVVVLLVMDALFAMVGLGNIYFMNCMIIWGGSVAAFSVCGKVHHILPHIILYVSTS